MSQFPCCQTAQSWMHHKRLTKRDLALILRECYGLNYVSVAFINGIFYGKFEAQPHVRKAISAILKQSENEVFPEYANNETTTA